MELNKIYNEDCLVGMKKIPREGVNCIITDIPYNECNRQSNGLRKLDKDKADVGDFDIIDLTKNLCDKTKGSIYMFCGINQVSTIRQTMMNEGLSTRIIVWEKTNPSPMNGNKIWLSGIELCVFGKKSKATFNLHSKKKEIRYPCGVNKIHPTQKPIALMSYIINASTKKGDTVLDPFMGSGTTAIACIREKRNFIGFELNKEYYDKACKRIQLEMAQPSLF